MGGECGAHDIYIYIYIYIYMYRERGGGQRENGNVYMILVGKSHGKKPLLRPRHRRDDKIKVDVKQGKEGGWTEFVWVSRL